MLKTSNLQYKASSQTERSPFGTAAADADAAAAAERLAETAAAAFKD